MGGFCLAVLARRLRYGSISTSGEAGILGLPHKRQLRQTVSLNDRPQHSGKALGVADLILHVVISLKHRIVPAGVRLHHGVAVLEMVLDAAKLKVGVPLQRLRERREGLVLG